LIGLPSPNSETSLVVPIHAFATNPEGATGPRASMFVQPGADSS
jgi:hypothetical protein